MYIKLFEQFIAEDLHVNENISITPRWANVFFDGIKKRIGAKRVNIDKLGDMATIDFDDKLRLFAKDNQIIGYNLDMSETPLELGKTINSFGDIERNIKLFSGNDRPLKGKPAGHVQLPEIKSDGTKQWKNERGQLHRLDGPAVESADGTKYWYQNDKLHRLDGPAIEKTNGNKYWYQNGQRHRLDGPAIEWASGDKEWYQNGQRHRLDGPAIELASGDKHWYQNGQPHRLDGPAIEWVDGDKEWYINGKGVTEEEFLKKTNK